MSIKRPRTPSDTFDLSFPERKAFDLVGFGFNSVDLVCVVERYPPCGAKSEILRFERMPGGQAATAVIFASRMGLNSRYIGKTGGDDFGRMSLEALRSEGIDISNVFVEENAYNQLSIITIDKSTGERTVLWKMDGRLNFMEGELKRDAVCAGKVFLLDGCDPETALRASGWCREEGIPVVADLDHVVPHCAKLLKNVDFLIADEHFPSELMGVEEPVRALRGLADRFDGFLAVTLGARGAAAMVGGESVLFPGLNIRAVDTTGAGDIFHGAFIYGLASSKDHGVCQCGGGTRLHASGRPGGNPSSPGNRALRRGTALL
jgi:sugar/nucleoside kinase (ribokinase family)